MSGNMPKVFTDRPSVQKHALWVTEPQLDALLLLFDAWETDEFTFTQPMLKELYDAKAGLESLRRGIHGPGDNT
jgi:hypothetical protein